MICIYIYVYRDGLRSSQIGYFHKSILPPGHPCCLMHMHRKPYILLFRLASIYTGIEKLKLYIRLNSCNEMRTFKASKLEFKLYVATEKLNIQKKIFRH